MSGVFYVGGLVYLRCITLIYYFTVRPAVVISSSYVFGIASCLPVFLTDVVVISMHQHSTGTQSRNRPSWKHVLGICCFKLQSD